MEEARSKEDSLPDWWQPGAMALLLVDFQQGTCGDAQPSPRPAFDQQFRHHTLPAAQRALAVARPGGGGGAVNNSATLYSGSNGQSGTSGSNSGDGTGSGGTNGNGGTGSFNGWGGGGGGFTGNGTDAANVINSRGLSFTNGGTGGNTATTAVGGFGGGAGTHGNTGGGGGGGGYSGGGGSNQNSNASVAGGGGSYSQTTISVIGYNTSGTPDNFAILFHKDLSAGTIFYINDNEVASTGGTSFTDLGEVEASFTVKAGQTIPKGTVIILPWGTSAVSTTTYDWSSTSSAGLGNNNEELYIYTASSITATTPTAFIYFAKIKLDQVYHPSNQLFCAMFHP